MRSQALPAPAVEERRTWTGEIAARVTRLLRRRGLLEGDEAGRDETPSALHACQAASVRNVVAMGPCAGHPLRKIVLPGLARDDGRRTHERGRLERPCRYLLRPPLMSEPLDVLPDGRVKYGLRHA